MAPGPVRYQSELVEETVLRAVEAQAPEERRRFRARRNPLYEMPDPDERNAAFEALHGEWFLRLRLDRPLHQALAERPRVPAGVAECRVVLARSRKREMADLVACRGRDRPLLVVALCPETLLDAGALQALLRRELLHVADMLDPAFGYERELPATERPEQTERLRERYRAVWAATVEGRLKAEGRLAGVGADCRVQFERRFFALGDQVASTFERWLREPAPTHAAILEFSSSWR
jgi:hypothetical protein